MPSSFRNRFAASFDSSMVGLMFKALKERILYAPLMTYGVIVFGFALFMLMSQTLMLFLTVIRSPFVTLSHFSGDDNVLIITYMIIAVVLLTVSLTLMFAKKGSLISFIDEPAIA